MYNVPSSTYNTQDKFQNNDFGLPLGWLKTSRRGGNSHAFWTGQDERPSAVYRTVSGLSYSLVSLGSFTLKDQQVANNVELFAYISSVYIFE
jgi:hypothetical protein